jgi:hypothetical protein
MHDERGVPKLLVTISYPAVIGLGVPTKPMTPVIEPLIEIASPLGSWQSQPFAVSLLAHGSALRAARGQAPRSNLSSGAPVPSVRLVGIRRRDWVMLCDRAPVTVAGRRCGAVSRLGSHRRGALIPISADQAQCDAAAEGIPLQGTPAPTCPTTALSTPGWVSTASRVRRAPGTAQQGVLARAEYHHATPVTQRRVSGLLGIILAVGFE